MRGVLYAVLEAPMRRCNQKIVDSSKLALANQAKINENRDEKLQNKLETIQLDKCDSHNLVAEGHHDVDGSPHEPRPCGSVSASKSYDSGLAALVVTLPALELSNARVPALPHL